MKLPEFSVNRKVTTIMFAMILVVLGITTHHGALTRKVPLVLKSDRIPF